MNGGDPEIDEETESIAEDEAVPPMRGQLLKLGGRTIGKAKTSWQQRDFELDEAQLSWKGTKPGSGHSLLLRDIESISKPINFKESSGKKIQLVFIVQCSSAFKGAKRYVFAADSEGDRDSWFDALEFNISNVDPETPRNRTDKMAGAVKGAAGNVTSGTAGVAARAADVGAKGKAGAGAVGAKGKAGAVGAKKGAQANAMKGVNAGKGVQAGAAAGAAKGVNAGKAGAQKGIAATQAEMQKVKALSLSATAMTFGAASWASAKSPADARKAFEAASDVARQAAEQAVKEGKAEAMKAFELAREEALSELNSFIEEELGFDLDVGELAAELNGDRSISGLKNVTAKTVKSQKLVVLGTGAVGGAAAYGATVRQEGLVSGARKAKDDSTKLATSQTKRVTGELGDLKTNLKEGNFEALSQQAEKGAKVVNNPTLLIPATAAESKKNGDKGKKTSKKKGKNFFKKGKKKAEEEAEAAGPDEGQDEVQETGQDEGDDAE